MGNIWECIEYMYFLLFLQKLLSRKKCETHNKKGNARPNGVTGKMLLCHWSEDVFTIKITYIFNFNTFGGYLKYVQYVHRIRVSRKMFNHIDVLRTVCFSFVLFSLSQYRFARWRLMAYDTSWKTTAMPLNTNAHFHTFFSIFRCLLFIAMLFLPFIHMYHNLNIRIICIFLTVFKIS